MWVRRVGECVIMFPTRRDPGIIAKKMNRYSCPDKNAPGIRKAIQSKLKIEPIPFLYLAAKKAAQITATRLIGPRNVRRLLVNSAIAIRRTPVPPMTMYDVDTRWRFP